MPLGWKAIVSKEQNYSIRSQIQNKWWRTIWDKWQQLLWNLIKKSSEISTEQKNPHSLPKNQANIIRSNKRNNLKALLCKRNWNTKHSLYTHLKRRTSDWLKNKARRLEKQRKISITKNTNHLKTSKGRTLKLTGWYSQERKLILRRSKF